MPLHDVDLDLVLVRRWLAADAHRLGQTSLHFRRVLELGQRHIKRRERSSRCFRQGGREATCTAYIVGVRFNAHLRVCWAIP